MEVGSNDRPGERDPRRASEDYPALAYLHDAWVGSGKAQPEAVRALIEIEKLRWRVHDLLGVIYRQDQLIAALSPADD